MEKGLEIPQNVCMHPEKFCMHEHTYIRMYKRVLAPFSIIISGIVKLKSSNLVEIFLHTGH